MTDNWQGLESFENCFYSSTPPEGRGDSKSGLALGMLKRDWRMLQYCRKHRPDVLIGTSVEISHVGKLPGIPSFLVLPGVGAVLSLALRETEGAS